MTHLKGQQDEFRIFFPAWRKGCLVLIKDNEMG